MRSSVSPTAGRSGSASSIFVTTRRSSNSGWPAKRRRSPARSIDAAGRPVAGATVLPYFAYDRPIPGLLPATTDAEGRFKTRERGRLQVAGWQAGGHQLRRAPPGLSRDDRQGECAAGGCRRHAAGRVHRDGDRDGRRHRATRRGGRDHGPAGRRMARVLHRHGPGRTLSPRGAGGALRFPGRGEGSRLRRADRPRMPGGREGRSAPVRAHRRRIHLRPGRQHGHGGVGLRLRERGTDHARAVRAVSAAGTGHLPGPAGRRGRVGPVRPACRPGGELPLLRQHARRAHGLGHPEAAPGRREGRRDDHLQHAHHARGPARREAEGGPQARRGPVEDSRPIGRRRSSSSSASSITPSTRPSCGAC